jgi:hypothetical protein
VTPGPNEITGQDPLFVDKANSNCRLQNGSPAIDAGTNLASVTTDILEVARPQGLRTDIGAYEYYPMDGSLDVPVENTVKEGEIIMLQGSGSTESFAAINLVEYSLDGGATWLTAGVSAVDGAFDETSEDYTITLEDLPPGDYTLIVRVTDDNGYAFITDGRDFTIEAVNLPSTGDDQYTLLFGGIGHLI